MAAEALAIKSSVQMGRKKGWRRKDKELYLQSKTYPEILK